VDGKIRPVETIPGTWGGGIKNVGESELKYGIFDMLQEELL
jgi:hypothetical protein